MSTPPELWNAYEFYVRFCRASELVPMVESEWTALHETYLAKQPKSLEQRVTELERRMDDCEGEK